jgi:hypothetical protein
VDDSAPGDRIIGYGQYRIYIDGATYIVDYRDCDYEGKQPIDGLYSCHNSDIIVTYDPEDYTFSVSTSDPPSPYIWAKRCDGAGPRQNCFGAPPPPPPPAPQNLVITNLGQYGQSPELCWNASSGATSYNVYRKLSFDPNWSLTHNTTSTSHIDYSVSMSPPNTPDTYEFLYQVTAANSGGESTPSNTVSTWGMGWLKTASGMNEMAFAEAENFPEKFSLALNYPNPFNPETWIKYQLPTSAHVRLSIYNALGQEVRRLVDYSQPAAYHQVVWDGRDDAGNLLPTGVYFYRLEAEKFTAIKKMVMMK